MQKLKKLRVNSKYGVWQYLKYQDYDMEFPAYDLNNEDKSESYILAYYEDMLALVKQPTREAREKFYNQCC